MPKVILEIPATVSLQGTIVRSRVPTKALNALGALDGDAIQWQVQEGAGNILYIVGTVEKGGAANIERVPPTPPQRAAKKGGATKTATKKGAAAVLDEFADPASEDEDWVDDPQPAAAKKGPAKKVAAAPTPAKKGPAAPAKKKAVAYEVPTGGGASDEFAD